MAAISPRVDRAAVHRAALTLFAEQGYRSTTMADIGDALGIRGPSLYKHVSSKQDLLQHIMVTTMRELLDGQQGAIDAGDGPADQLRRMVEAHVRYHAAHREEAFVGNRELASLTPENRAIVLELRARYDHRLREVIEAGQRTGVFTVLSRAPGRIRHPRHGHGRLGLVPGFGRVQCRRHRPRVRTAGPEHAHRPAVNGRG